MKKCCFRASLMVIEWPNLTQAQRAWSRGDGRRFGWGRQRESGVNLGVSVEALLDDNVGAWQVGELVVSINDEVDIRHDG